MIKKYPTSTTTDGVEVEITFGDANCQPGSLRGQFVNSTICWFKPDGGGWMRSRYRSATKTSHEISLLKSTELHLVSDPIILMTEEADEQGQNGSATTAQGSGSHKQTGSSVLVVTGVDPSDKLVK